jgi:hypothetical protein
MCGRARSRNPPFPCFISVKCNRPINIKLQGFVGSRNIDLKKIPKQELAKKLKNEYFDLKGGYHEKE